MRAAGRRGARAPSPEASHPKVERLHFTGNPEHPDAATIRRLFPSNLYGAMVSFELKGAVVDHLSAKGHEVEDVGTFSTEPVDYPPICAAVARRAVNGGGTGIVSAIMTV